MYSPAVFILYNIFLIEPNKITPNVDVDIIGKNERQAVGIARCAILLANIPVWDQGGANYNIITLENVSHLKLKSLHRSAAWLDPK